MFWSTDATITKIWTSKLEKNAKCHSRESNHLSSTHFEINISQKIFGIESLYFAYVHYLDGTISGKTLKKIGDDHPGGPR